jgi:glycosyltransferase involved in cell wall biosynthesis
MAANQGEKPRLLLLGDARQVHLQRWARYFYKAGYEVLTFSHEEADRYPGDIRTVKLPPLIPRALRYPASTPIVRGLIRRFSPHVINAHFVPNYGLIAAMINREPWVLSTWGSDIMTDPDKSPFHKMRTKFALRRATYVTSDAELMTKRIVGLGVPQERVLTFPYGVDMNVFYPRAGPPPPLGPRILSNRKLEPVYSVSTVIDAFPAVREMFHDATLTIAGDGELRPVLAARANRSIGGRAIVFVGGVDHERMPTLLRDHHIYVSMSLSDTTSVSLLEAMATGLFPVVSDIPANREWITHAVNGLLVPVQQPMKLATTLISAWRDEELRESAIGVNLKLVREKAEWHSNMGTIHALFDQLVGAR